MMPESVALPHRFRFDASRPTFRSPETERSLRTSSSSASSQWPICAVPLTVTVPVGETETHAAAGAAASSSASASSSGRPARRGGAVAAPIAGFRKEPRRERRLVAVGLVALMWRRFASVAVPERSAGGAKPSAAEPAAPRSRQRPLGTDGLAAGSGSPISRRSVQKAAWSSALVSRDHGGVCFVVLLERWHRRQEAEPSRSGFLNRGKHDR